MSKPLGLLAYILSGLLLSFYAGVMWFVAHPQVNDDYRAYYIDQSTTCMNQPVPGTYSFGKLVSFLPDGLDEAKPLRVCGWEGPAGDGTHAVGTSARLRFNPPERPATMALVLKMIAITTTKAGRQTVSVSLDGVKLGDLDVVPGAPSSFKLPIPPELAARPGPLTFVFDFVTAVQMGPTDPKTRWRSIKLQEAGLVAG